MGQRRDETGQRAGARWWPIMVVTAALCLSCTAQDETEGVAEVQAGAAGATSSTASGAGSAAGDTTAATAAGGATTAATANTAVAGGSGVTEVASLVTLLSETAEMNTQPDDVEWGLLTVDDAYSLSSYGTEFAAGDGNKLVVVDIELLPVVNGNLTDAAFRLQADGRWYSPVSNLNETPGLGDVVNTSLVFDVPAGATELTLEGGLPEELGPGRRTSWGITLEPGSPLAEPLPSDAEMEVVASGVTLTSPSKEINLQPDDNEWGLLVVTGARSTVLFEELAATKETKLVVVEVEITVGEGGNLLDNAFRLRANGEWYSNLNDLNETPSTGAVVNAPLVFEVPRSADQLTLEGGFPGALASYPWDFPLRSTTYEITL